jgi:hypothetical protein
MTTHKKSEQWLDDMITRAINAPPAKFEPDLWHRKYARQLESDALENPVSQTIKLKQHFLGRFPMKSRMTQIAAAVLVIGFVAIAGYFLATPGRSGVAWAQVAQQVQQARSFSYKMDMTMNGVMAEGQPAVKDQKMYAVYYFSDDYGMKMQTLMNDQIAQEMYIKPGNNSAVMLMPTAKKFMRMEFNEEMVQRMKQQTHDPRDIFKQLPNCQFTPIGRDTIDGIDVEGVESTDPKLVGGMFDTVHVRLWSDARDGWPVRMEFSCSTNNNQFQMDMAAHDFQWNIDFDPAEFTCEIPADYSEMPKMQMPAMNADAAIPGLKKFVEITGRYPKSLNLMNMIQEITKAKPDLKKPEDPGPKDESERMNVIMKEMMPIQYLGMFYMQLVQQDKNPKYYGETVTPDDADAVLLRWKSADNEYTVIFGDLSTQTVTPDELADLETPEQ